MVEVTMSQHSQQVSAEQSGSNSQAILLGSVGVSAARENDYYYKERTCHSQFSSLALWQLLEPRPDQVWFLLTPQARSTNWTAIQHEAARLGVGVNAIELTTEQAEDPVSFLEAVAERLPPNTTLYLNVTEGFRHHAFLYYALALYLTTFRQVKIAGVWYCLFEGRVAQAPKPFVDLKPVLDLARWFHAIAIFRDLGSAREITHLLEPLIEQRETEARLAGNDVEKHKKARQLRSVRDALDEYTFAYESGFPLELGRAGYQLVRRVEELADRPEEWQLPLAQQLFDRLREVAERVALDQVTRNNSWKQNVPLTREELKRQAGMIHTYRRRKQWALGAGLMREWVISWLMYQNGCTQDWLSHRAREPYQKQLGVLANLLRRPEERARLSDDQRQLAEFWHSLTDELRNVFHHHAHRPEPYIGVPTRFEDVWQAWQNLVQSLDRQLDRSSDRNVVRQIGGGRGKLLLCPLGLSPGVLFSAVSHVQPDRVIAVGSPQTLEATEDAVRRAGSNAEVLPIAMQNPHSGVSEFPAIIDKARQWIYEADEVYANLTGGTALLGILIGEMVSEAQRQYLRPVHKFVLIDKRSPEEQRRDPWLVSEIFYLKSDQQKLDA